MSMTFAKSLFYMILFTLTVMVLAYQIRNIDLLVFALICLIAQVSVGMGWWYRQDYLRSLKEESW